MYTNFGESDFPLLNLNFLLNTSLDVLEQGSRVMVDILEWVNFRWLISFVGQSFSHRFLGLDIDLGTPLQHSCLENPVDGGAWWAAVHGVTKSRTRLSNFTFAFHFHALEKEMATHSSVLAWRIPGTGEPHGLLSMGSHRVRHDWSDLAAVAAGSVWSKTAVVWVLKIILSWFSGSSPEKVACSQSWYLPLIHFLALISIWSLLSLWKQRESWKTQQLCKWCCDTIK